MPGHYIFLESTTKAKKKTRENKSKTAAIMIFFTLSVLNNDKKLVKMEKWLVAVIVTLQQLHPSLC